MWNMQLKLLQILFLLLKLNLCWCEFVCEKDGHFGDENDCTKYYHCANGRASAGFCPSGLFWNKATNQCDWPQLTDCDFTVEKARKIQIENPTLVYLTFDDGPSEGSEEVLDALKAYGVPATFFINSKNLEHDPKKPDQAAKNANYLIRMVEEGHMLGDHSYDHMFHNSDGPTNAYQDLENDVRYFGEMNSKPVITLLKMANFDQESQDFTNYTMSYFIRMPYSNIWRVRVNKERQPFLIHDCSTCTLPAKSGRLGTSIANHLSQVQRADVFGWDMEWNMNFNTNRIKYGGLQMFMRLGTGQHSKDRGKVVVLSHDKAFRQHEITGGDGHKKELLEFLDLATSAGYQFRTLDTFYSD